MINYWGDILINIVAAFIFLLVYETLIKRLFVFFKYYGLRGYYLVCSQGGQVFYNSPDGTPNFLKIDISFWSPNVLVTKSKDFDKTYLKKWKTWTGKIVMNELTDDYGSGFYVYEKGAEPGLHEIFIKDKTTGTILVRVTDYGKANLREGQDNVSALQNWKKVDKNDKLIDDLKKVL
jgi:hypothetical protein